jgi:hypothetical protein
MRPFRWPRLLEIGLGMMGLPPATFWNMSLPEWHAAFDGFTKLRGMACGRFGGRPAAHGA